MTDQETNDLLIKYKQGTCTEAEKTLLEAWLLSYNEHEVDLSQDHIEKIGNQIYAELPIHIPVKKINLWHGIAAIAAISLLTLTTWHLFDTPIVTKENIIVKDVAPGGNKAILKLENGEIINLSHSKTGVTLQGNEITYTDGTKLATKNQEVNNSTKQSIYTPVGGQYQVILSDGTKVWLNAASSISYPSSFTNAKERIIKLNGEAYFEVAKQVSLNGKRVPFFVKTATQTVEVLGTHFNISSYTDNPSTVTTLVEGSVRVTDQQQKLVLLIPNQQSVVTQNNIIVQKADLETALAWKNGRIEFKDADLKTILKEVSRWYNIEVSYSGALTKRTFNGSVSRQSNLSVLLKILAYNNINFSITQDQHTKINKLIVKP